MANSVIKNNKYPDMVKAINYIGHRIMVWRNVNLSFTNGVATDDVSSIYSGNEVVGFWYFPYNENEKGILPVSVSNGVVTFKAATSTTNNRYVNYVLFIP